MTISAGDRLPDVELLTMTADGPAPVRTGEALGKGKVVLFAVPGAFTPGCSKVHLPGYVAHGAELKAKGVEFTDEVKDMGYGLVTHFKMPGDFAVQLYQPRYKVER